MTDEEQAAREGDTNVKAPVRVEGAALFSERDFLLPFLATRRRASRISLLAACAVLLMVSVLLLKRQTWLSGFSGAVGTMFLFLGIWHSLGPRYLARQHVQGLHPDEIPVRYGFDEEGMTISGSWGTSFYRYRGIHAFVEYRTALLVQTGPVLRMVVPKRAFSHGDLQVVLGLLRSNVKARASALGTPGSGLMWRYFVLWVTLLLLVLVAAGVIDLSGWR
jgi:hypothetical protein